MYCSPQAIARRVVYGSARSIRAPQGAAERLGVVAPVVFPTGLDARADGPLDICYGTADSRIGVARACARDLRRRGRARRGRGIDVG
jgi:predicted GH43/DUF377 family glycosyl hydrolase